MDQRGVDDGALAQRQATVAQVTVDHRQNRCRRLDGRAFYAWLLPWFNPAPTLTGEPAQDFYRRVRQPEADTEDSLELPFDHAFAERLFFSEPRADSDQGLWYFDSQPHRVMVVDRLRRAPRIGQLCGKLPRGDALNALFDQLPEGCILSLTLVIKPQDVLEAQLTRGAPGSGWPRKIWRTFRTRRRPCSI